MTTTESTGYEPGGAYLALLGLSSFVFALPLLDTLGQGATFFTAHKASNGPVVTFALAVFLLPSLLMAGALYVLSRLRAGLASASLNVLVSALAGIWLLTAIPADNVFVLLPTSVAGGMIMGWLYARSALLKSILSIVGIASPLVLIYFFYFHRQARCLHASRF